MRRFLTIFARCENVHLIKDVGMIPYILHKEFSYDSTIASYKNGSYPYLETEVQGLKHDYIKKITGNNIVDSCIYLVFNFRKFDVLQIYHFQKSSLILGGLFKLLKYFDKKSIVYLKTDAPDGIKDVHLTGVKGALIGFLLKKIDIISIETRINQNFLNVNRNLRKDVKLIHNGFYDNGIKTIPDYTKKTNKIITVGRIGHELKSHETLLEAYVNFSSLNPKWSLELVGPVEPDFEAYIGAYFTRFPHLVDRVTFTGALIDRDALKEKYNQAKIFVLSSVYEGFPLVFLEAVSSGCFIITSDVTSAYDITNMGEFGKIYEKGSVQGLLDALIEVTSDEKLITDNFERFYNYGYQTFYWPNICAKLDREFNNISNLPE